jgi:hypothetical protein
MEEGQGDQGYDDEGFENGSDSVVSDSKDDGNAAFAQSTGQFAKSNVSQSAFEAPCDSSSKGVAGNLEDNGSSGRSGSFPGIQRCSLSTDDSNDLGFSRPGPIKDQQEDDDIKEKSYEEDFDALDDNDSAGPRHDTSFSRQHLVGGNTPASISSGHPMYQVEPACKDGSEKSAHDGEKEDRVQHANDNMIREGMSPNKEAISPGFEESTHEKTTTLKEKSTSVEMQPRERSEPSLSSHSAQLRSAEYHDPAMGINSNACNHAHNPADHKQREEKLAQDKRGRRVLPDIQVAFAMENERGADIPAAPIKRDDAVRPPSEETLAQQRASIAKNMRRFVRVNVEVFVEYCTAKRSGDEVNCQRKCKEGSTLRGTHEAYHDLYEKLRTALAGREFLLNPERVVVFANHSCLSEISRATHTRADTPAQKQRTPATAANRCIMTSVGGLPISQEAGAVPAPKSPPRLKTWGEGTRTVIGDFETTGLQHSHAHRHFPRLGAFEVWVRVFSSDALELVASKLGTGQFPTGMLPWSSHHAMHAARV